MAQVPASGDPGCHSVASGKRRVWRKENEGKRRRGGRGRGRKKERTRQSKTCLSILRSSLALVGKNYLFIRILFFTVAMGGRAAPSLGPVSAPGSLSALALAGSALQRRPVPCQSPGQECPLGTNVLPGRGAQTRGCVGLRGAVAKYRKPGGLTPTEMCALESGGQNSEPEVSAGRCVSGGSRGGSRRLFQLLVASRNPWCPWLRPHHPLLCSCGLIRSPVIRLRAHPNPV